MTIDTGRICEILSSAHAAGRHNLFEHECYEVLQAIGAEAAPSSLLIARDERPTAADLERLSGDKVVLKIISPDITHKTEARGVRIVAREIGAVEAAFELMLREVPETYARYLENHRGEIPPGLAGRRGRSLEQHLAGRLTGVLLCSFVPPDSHGFATELFVGIRATSEFGPIISAGLGGVETELLAQQTREGAAVAIAPTGTVDGDEFFQLFRRTLSYERLSGAMRGSRRLVDDGTLVRCFQAFTDLANHFSVMDPETNFHLQEVEVNPFVATGGRLAPLDGVCRFEPAATRPASRPIHKLENLLKPDSAAVIGVSEHSRNLGRIILANMLSAGFPPEQVHIVHPKAHTLDGVNCVATVRDLPKKVDLLVAAVGAYEIPALVDDVIEHDKANTVILIPGGIGEKRGSGALESRLRRRIREAHERSDGGPLVMGGNSLGVVSEPGRYDTMFIPQSKLPKARTAPPQPLCFISQSGAFIVSTLSDEPWLNPAYALSIGNQIDLTAGDLLAYLHDDPGIDVFAVYMEGFRPCDGYAFAAATERAVANGKKVVFYKAGRTTEGRSATAGHTASVAGDYAVCENAMRQAGALVAKDFGEFSDLLRLALTLGDKVVDGNRIAAVSNAGFEAVGMADSIRPNGAELELPAFSARTEEALLKILADNRLDGLVDVRNPLDVTPMTGDTAFADIVAELLSDPGIDAAIVGIVPLTPSLQTLPAGEGHAESIQSPDSIAQRLPRIAGASGKPVVAVVDAGPLFDPFANALRAGGLPVFRSADRAVRTVCKWLDVNSYGADRGV
ncbi:MAG: CoA-binding protein [Xanthomonadales bacterium]|nr:CoA-binding protein [Xanthomonadales bacterium]